MSDIRYVVAALPRSGTKYISTVLSKLGLKCGHERHFRYNRAHTALDGVEGIWGDASWMAAPFISGLPPGTIVLHQVRDPIKVLNSNLPPGGDSYFRTWNDDAGLASDPLYNKDIPWKRFIWTTTQDWVWPEGQQDYHEGPEEIQRLIHWWVNWNLWIEFSATRRSDLVYFRYQIEDIACGNQLQDLVKLIDPESNVSLRDCQQVFDSVSTTTNRHRKPNDKLTVDMLPDHAKLLMHRYGYDSFQIS